MRRHQIVGKCMPQRHRLGLDQAANRNEAEPMILQMAVDPLDELAKSVYLLAGLRSHPAAPLLYALRFPRPLFRPLGERCRLDVVALARCWRKYLHRTRRMLGQRGNVFAGGVMGVDQKFFRGLAIAPDHVIHHRCCQTRFVAPTGPLARSHDSPLRAAPFGHSVGPVWNGPRLAFAPPLVPSTTISASDTSPSPINAVTLSLRRRSSTSTCSTRKSASP